MALMKAVWLPATADAGRAAVATRPPSLLRLATGRVAAAQPVPSGQS